MANVNLGDGIALELPEDVVAVQAAPASPTRRGGLSGSSLDASIDEALLGADFQIVKDFELRPAPAARDDDGRRLRRTAPQDPVRLNLAVEPGVDAVVLLETEGGVLSWLRPDEAMPDRRGGEAVMTFTLAQPGHVTERGRRSLLGWLGERLLEPIRVRVLKFVALTAIEALKNHIEGDLAEGLVILGDDVAGWTAQGLAPPVAQDSPARVLLMVHGTFSTTIGSFQALTTTDEGRRFLDEARDRYDVILGFDHKTLDKDPDQNAQDILEALKGLPQDSMIDAIAYSRGGLVLRALTERYAPADRPDLSFRHSIFVGCTNGGTTLAEPRNWQAMVDLYSNLFAAAGRLFTLVSGAAVAPVVSIALKTLARFVQILPQVAITEGAVPGLKAMQPRPGTYVAGLNDATSVLPSVGSYGVISSDFEPRIELSKGLTGELVEFLADGLVDHLLAQDNDLVVHTAAMDDFGSREPLLDPGRNRRLDPADTIYHTIYFASPKVADQLREWLMPTARMVEPEIDLSPRRGGDFGIRIEAMGAPGGAPGMDFGLDNIVIAAGPPTAAAAEPERGPVPEPARAPYHFAAETNPSPSLSTATPLFVTLSRELIQVAAHAGAAALADPVAVDLTRRVKILVIPLQNCEVVGEASIEVDPPERGLTQRFMIQGLAAGRAKVLVEARQGAAILAAFALEPTFVDDRAEKLTASASLSPTPVGQPVPTMLRIYELRGNGDSVTLRFDLSSDAPNINEIAHSETALDVDDLSAFSADFLAQFEESWTRYPHVYDDFLADFQDFAASKARDLIPEDIRQALWRHRGQIKAIQVLSDTPHIPWELLVIKDPAGVEPEGRFLSEWGLFRWIYGAPWPSRELPMRPGKIRYVIPEYRNPANRLPGAQAELDMLKRRFSDPQAVEASSQGVRRFLAREAADCDVLHFACHGQAIQNAVLKSDLLMMGIDTPAGVKEDTLIYDTVEEHARFGPNGPSGLVFINACQTGRDGKGLAGPVGFAESFIKPASRQGAAAFIGALWSVGDTLALTFADTLYNHLLTVEGATLVDAVHAAREECKKSKQDFTWLAYSIYGAPFAKRVG